MTKLLLAGVLVFCAAASARAQVNPASRHTGQDTLREALAEPDPVRREERLIARTNRANARMEEQAKSGRAPKGPAFKARIDVTNRSGKRIESVSWTATLTDPATGAVVRSYEVTTKARIAPGETKRLTEKFETPRAGLVLASDPTRRSPRVADLKVAVRSVTYEDGTTSATP